MGVSRRRWLLVSAVLMLFVSLGHTIASLAPATDPSQISLESSMRAFRFSPSLGMSPSKLDAFTSLLFFVTVTFAAFGILNLVLARALDFPDRLLRRVIWINFLWVAGFMAVSCYYRCAPPLIGTSLIELPLIAALTARG